MGNWPTIFWDTEDHGDLINTRSSYYHFGSRLLRAWKITNLGIECARRLSINVYHDVYIYIMWQCGWSMTSSLQEILKRNLPWILPSYREGLHKPATKFTRMIVSKGKYIKRHLAFQLGKTWMDKFIRSSFRHFLHGEQQASPAKRLQDI